MSSKYTRDEAARDAKAIYKSAQGRRFLNYLMDQAGIGSTLGCMDSDQEKKKVGAHDFAVENISNLITKQPRRQGK